MRNYRFPNFVACVFSSRLKELVIWQQTPALSSWMCTWTHPQSLLFRLFRESCIGHSRSQVSSAFSSSSDKRCRKFQWAEGSSAPALSTCFLRLQAKNMSWSAGRKVMVSCKRIDRWGYLYLWILTVASRIHLCMSNNRRTTHLSHYNGYNFWSY